MRTAPDRTSHLPSVLAAALTCAVTDLAEHTAADGHPDFYIPLIMHARRLLQSHAPAATVSEWDSLLRSIIPENAYRDTAGRRRR
jgi:hypothetical protein